jgi:hypothetical protein
MQSPMFGADSNQALRNSVRGYNPRAHLLKLLLVFNIACVIVYAVRTAKRIGGVTAKRKPVRLQPQNRSNDRLPGASFYISLRPDERLA